MHRLEDFADIFNHRESANALEKFGEGLRHKLASDLVFQVVQDMLCRVPVPSVETPLIDLVVVQLRFDVIHDRFDHRYLWRHLESGWAEEDLWLWQDAITRQLELFLKIMLRVHCLRLFRFLLCKTATTPFGAKKLALQSSAVVVQQDLCELQ